MKSSIRTAVFCSLVAVSLGTLAKEYSTSLSANTGLHPGDALYSSNKKYVLTLQAGDGNLVVYRTADMKPIWATYAYNGKFAVVQPDGNFVVYDTAVTPALAVWNSGTWTTATTNDVHLYIEDRGALVLKRDGVATWATPSDRSCPGGGNIQFFPICITNGSLRWTESVPVCTWAEALEYGEQKGRAKPGACR